MQRSVSPPSKRKRSEDGDLLKRTKRFEIVQNDGNHNELVIYSWNVNGIGPFIQKSITSFFPSAKTTASQSKSQDRPPTASLRGFLRRHHWPTLLYLQEVKINPDDLATIEAVRKSINSKDPPTDEPCYQAHFCLPSERYNARGFGRKVYGVCSIIRSDFAAQNIETIRPVTWDSEGRVLVIETKKTAVMPALAIFNIYAVNGTTFPYKNPETGEDMGTRHDRKLEFHRLLAEECRRLEENGFAVILAGDINVARGEIDGYPNLRTVPHQHCLNRADFEKRFFLQRANHTKGEPDGTGEEGVGLGMIDTFRHLFPHQKGYTYYPRTKSFGDSCDRVDMIMTSSSLQDNVVDAGMHETLQERGTSDHVPLFARLSFDKKTHTAAKQ